MLILNYNYECKTCGLKHRIQWRMTLCVFCYIAMSMKIRCETNASVNHKLFAKIRNITSPNDGAIKL